MRFRFAAAFIVVVLAIAFGHSSASGQISWTNSSGDSQWANPRNWSTGSVPGPNDFAIFDDSAIGASRAVDLGGITRNVFEIDFREQIAPYTLTNGTLRAGYIAAGPSADIVSANVNASPWTFFVSSSTPTTYSGVISGALGPTGSGVNASGAVFTGANTYNLPTQVESGGLVISGAAGSINQSQTINLSGVLRLDNTNGVNADRISNTATLHLTAGTLEMDTGNPSVPTTEAVGTFSLDSLTNVLRVVSNGAASTISLNNLVRNNNSTLVLDLSGTTPSLAHVLVGNATSLPLVGGAQWGTPNVSIVPYVVGPGAALATYDPGPDGRVGTSDDVGLRLLSPETEYLSTIPAGLQTLSNVRIAINQTVSDSASINALSINSATLTVNPGKQLTISSGALAMAGSSGGLTALTGTGTLMLVGDEAIVSTEGLASQTDSQPRYSVDVPITASGTLVKAGTGTLVLTHSNALTGGVVISAGTLVSSAGGSLGTGTITLSGGTLSFESANQSLANPFSFVRSANPKIDVADQLQVELSGDLSGGNFYKTGPGALRLTGHGSTIDNATVSAGLLRIDGEVPLAVIEGGILSGSGTIDSFLNMENGVLSPGAGSVSGTSTLTVGMLNEREGTYRPTVMADRSDQIRVQSLAVVAGSTLDVQVGSPLIVGQQFTIIDNLSSGPVNGPFEGNLFEGATFYVGNDQFQITYQGGDGNDVVLTVLSVPEPSMGVAGIFGASCLLLRRRKERR